MALLSLGINHLTAPVDIREKVAFAPEQMTVALHELQDIPAINESVIVSTCNRTEIYCDASSDCSEVITHWLTAHHGINENSLSPYIYHHSEQEVARHLFRVASGLDSMVLGEPQILGQLKDSYDRARGDNSINSILDRLFQHSFSVAKRVRTDTEIGSNPVSVAFAAVSLSKQIFGNLNELHALLIGAGETIELVSRHLKSQQIGSMTIANRSVDRARLLADQIGAEAVQINAVTEQLVRADIVISSTASQLADSRQRRDRIGPETAQAPPDFHGRPCGAARHRTGSRQAAGHLSVYRGRFDQLWLMKTCADASRPPKPHWKSSISK